MLDDTDNITQSNWARNVNEIGSVCFLVFPTPGRLLMAGLVLSAPTYIFPLEKEDLWIRENFGRRTTDVGDTACVSKIDSCQNGFLLQSNVHQHFDSYLLSVNPDMSNSATDFVTLPH
jgi:HNH endonuclease